MSTARIEAALRKLDPLRVDDGAVVVRQGDEADRFYVIASGSFVVTRREPGDTSSKVLRTLGRDDVFGERGLLGQIPRTATVTASGSGLLFTMDAASFLALVSGRRGVAERFLALYDAPAADAASGRPAAS
jgi:CRP-like cAMP-binding protein